jgi:hypothetical protein
MASPVLIAVPVAFLLALFFGGKKSTIIPDDLPDIEPFVPPTPDNEPDTGPVDDFTNLPEDQLLALLCPVWLGAIKAPAKAPTASDATLATQLLKGLFPTHAWPPTTMSPSGAMAHARASSGFASIRSGDWSCIDDVIDPNDIHPTPTAGGYYQMKQGDNGFGIIKQAYPQIAAANQGTERVKALKLITGDPLNAGIKVPTTLQGHKDLGITEIWSFFPKWRKLPDPFDLPMRVSQRFEPGGSFAIVYLPVLF